MSREIRDVGSFRQWNNDRTVVVFPTIVERIFS